MNVANLFAEPFTVEPYEGRVGLTMGGWRLYKRNARLKCWYFSTIDEVMTFLAAQASREMPLYSSARTTG